MSTTRTFPPRREALPRISRFIDECLTSAGTDEDDRFAMTLAVDEACTNIVLHGGPPEESTLRVSCRVDPQAISVAIEDRGRPFDPHDAPLPDTDADLPHRRIGGLGVYFIRTLTDRIEYGYRDGTNWLVLIRHRRPLTPPPGPGEG
ncbi:MAG: ATP-binding protein [Methanomicrobiales archaeon]